MTWGICGVRPVRALAVAREESRVGYRDLLRALSGNSTGSHCVVSHTAPGVDFKHLGWTFLIRAHGFGKAFLRTDVFDLSYSGETIPPKDLIQSMGQELQGLERHTLLDGTRCRDRSRNKCTYNSKYRVWHKGGSREAFFCAI